MNPNFIEISAVNLSKSRQYYIDEAVAVALKSPLQMKHGAVLVKNRQIVGRGHNMGYNTPLSSNRSTHAEIATLMDAGNYLNFKDATMYVVRVSIRNDVVFVMNSHPCQDCLPKLLKCMRIHGLKNVYYSS